MFSVDLSLQWHFRHHGQRHQVLLAVSPQSKASDRRAERQPDSQERIWPFGGSKGRGLVLATNQLFKVHGVLGTRNTCSRGWKQDSAPGK